MTRPAADNPLAAHPPKQPGGRTVQARGTDVTALEQRQQAVAQHLAELERTMRTKEGTSLWYLSAMNRLAGSGDVRVVSIEGLDWGELDFAADLAPARAMAAAWQENEAAAKVA